MSRRNPCLKAALAELSAVGITPIISQTKHLHLRWFTELGESQHLIVSVSSSDHRAPKNARAQVRRMLRASEGAR
jgi:hypothetical protein